MKRALAAPVVVLFLPIAGWTQSPEHGLRIGRLVVSSLDWDVFNNPDFQVRVRRRDPAVEERIAALDGRIREFRDEAARLENRMAPLRQKEAQSKIEPGPPLTESEHALRAVLSEMPLAEASDAQVAELRRLNRKDEESRRQPGPPLTATEAEELQSLTDRQGDVERDLQGTVSERSRTEALIYGRTRTLSSGSRTMDFESQRVLTVYAGDVLLITVVDEDVVSADEVIGQYTLPVSPGILADGSVELGPADSVRALEQRPQQTCRRATGRRAARC